MPLVLRQFARHSLIYGASTLIVRGLNLLLVPIYTRVLAPADYGLVDLSAVVVAVVGVTVALEIAQGLARHLSEAETSEVRGIYASSALAFAIGAYGLFSVVGLVLAEPLSYLVFGPLAPPGLMQLVVTTATASGILQLVLNVLRWNLRPVSYVACSVTYGVTVIGASSIFVLVLGLDVFGVILGQLTGTIAGTSLALWLARHLFHPAVDRAALGEMLRFSIPLVPSGIAVLITLYIDRLAIRGFMTVADVGLFGVGYRVASIAGLAMIGLQAALTPLIYTNYRDVRMPEQLARIFRTFIGFAIVMVLGLALFAREILVVVSAPAYYDAAVVIPLLAPALLLSSMYIFAPGLAIARRTGPIAAIHIASALTNTALNLSLIPVLGIAGAAVATLFSATLTFGAYMVLSQRHYPVPHDWLRLAGAACVGGASLWTGLVLDPAPPWNLPLRVGLLVIAAGMLGWLRLIRPAELRAFMRAPSTATAQSAIPDD